MAPRSQFRVHDIPPPPDKKTAKRGRPKLYPEQIRLPCAAGMTARIDAVRREGEDRLDLIRSAIEREIKRRERAE